MGKSETSQESDIFAKGACVTSQAFLLSVLLTPSSLYSDFFLKSITVPKHTQMCCLNTTATYSLKWLVVDFGQWEVNISTFCRQLNLFGEPDSLLFPPFPIPGKLQMYILCIFKFTSSHTHM